MKKPQWETKDDRRWTILVPLDDGPGWQVCDVYPGTSGAWRWSIKTYSPAMDFHGVACGTDYGDADTQKEAMLACAPKVKLPRSEADVSRSTPRY